MATSLPHFRPWFDTKESVKDDIERLLYIKDLTDIVCMKGKYWELIVEDFLIMLKLFERT